MIALLPLNTLITAVALLYASIVVVLIAGLSTDSSSITDNLSLALQGGALLNAILLAVIYFGWRWIWRKIPKLNQWIFPDLNGNWDVAIHWVWNGNSGIATGQAVVKQNLLTLSMELTTDKSESETLLARPKRHPESGRPLIYYIYRNTPKMKDANSGPPHEGTAVLKIDSGNIGILRGNYFTDRETKGHFEMTKRG